MPDQTAVPTYAELMDRAIRAEEKIVRLISEAERTEERLTDERNDARARVAELEAAQAEARRIHDESPGECYHCPRCQDADESQREADRARIAELEALADRVRCALAGHPRCEIHPDDDVIACGWKRAVADVQRALETVELREVNRG